MKNGRMAVFRLSGFAVSFTLTFMSETEVRHKVPENDPRYLEIRREALQKTQHAIWGTEAMKDYEHGMHFATRVHERVEELQQDKRKLGELEEALALGRGPDTRAEERVEDAARIERGIQSAEEQEARFREEAMGVFQPEFLRLVGEIDLLGGTPFTDREKFLLRKLGYLFMWDDESRTEMKKLFGPDLKGFTTTGVWMKLKYDEIPPEVLHRAMLHHQDHMNEQLERFDALFEDIKRDFIEQVERGIKEGWLPVPIERLRSRLELVKGKMIDTFLAVGSMRQGSHNANGVIEVYDHLLSPESADGLRHTIFHELLHEISGRTIEVRGEKIVADRKSGISMKKGGPFSTGKFVWLNEAVTEKYALRLSGFRQEDDGTSVFYDGSASYGDERKQLDRLMDAGLDERTILEAFFEDIDSTKSPGEQGRRWGALVSEIREVEKDPNALTRMEHEFAMRNAASELLESGIREQETDSLVESSSDYHADETFTACIGTRPENRVCKTFTSYYYSADETKKEERKRLLRERLNHALHILRSRYGTRFSLNGKDLPNPPPEPEVYHFT